MPSPRMVYRFPVGLKDFGNFDGCAHIVEDHRREVVFRYYEFSWT